MLGVFSENNGRMTKVGSIVERYKAVMMVNSVDLDGYVKELLGKRLLMAGTKTSGDSTKGNHPIASSCNTNDHSSSTALQLYNMSFLTQGVQLFSAMGSRNRLKLFSRMRSYY